MATNHYFNHYGENTPDQRLIENLIIESIKVYGIDVHYMPRTLIKEDSLYGEDRLSQFKDQRMIEMYIKNVDGFGGDGTFVSNFGLEVRDQITLTVSRRRFKELNFETNGRDVEPKAGDLIYFPLTDGLFTILDVQSSNVFYQAGTLQSFDLVCELFSYSDEKIDTDIEEIDNIEVENSYYIEYNFATGTAATATASISTGGVVTSLSLASGGTAYRNAPTVSIAAPVAYSGPAKFGTGALELTTSTQVENIHTFASNVTDTSGTGFELGFWIYFANGELAGQNTYKSILFTDNFKLAHDGDGRIRVENRSGTQIFSADGLFSEQTWTYVRFVDFQGSYKIVIGTQVASNAGHTTGTFFDSGDILRAGYASDSDSVMDTANDSFKGALDNVILNTISSNITTFTIPTAVRTGNVFTRNFERTTATATATISNGSVTALSLTSGGTSYLSAPVVTIAAAPSNFNIGDTVTGATSGIVGEISYIDTINNKVRFINNNGTFTNGEIVYSSDGNSYIINPSGQTINTQNIPNADNTDIETDADSILDFTEENPFGSI